MKSNKSESRYAKTKLLARYVEMEWGGILLKSQRVCQEQPYYFDQRTEAFYTNVRDLIKEQGIRPRRILDAGSATGRMVWELCKLFKEAREIVGCDPSERFCTLSKQILGKSPLTDKWLPIPSSPLRDCRYIKITSEFRKTVKLNEELSEKICLFECEAQSVPRPDGHFDLICCLNVVDRVPDPQNVVDALNRLLRPGGVLVLASPFDWEDKTTPEKSRAEDLREFLKGPSWRVVSGTNLEYTVRQNTRKVTSYSSQVLLVKKSGPRHIKYEERYRDAFIQLYQRTWSEAPAYKEVFQELEVATDVIDKLDDLWLALLEGSVIGFTGGSRLALHDNEQVKTLLSPQLDEAYYIAELGVSPEEQGRGFGREILEFLIDELSHRGYRHFVLNTTEDPANHAPRLYKACGFELLQDEGGKSVFRTTTQMRTNGVERSDRRVYYYKRL